MFSMVKDVVLLEQTPSLSSQSIAMASAGSNTSSNAGEIPAIYPMVRLDTLSW